MCCWRHVCRWWRSPGDLDLAFFRRRLPLPNFAESQCSVRWWTGCGRSGFSVHAWWVHAVVHTGISMDLIFVAVLLERFVVATAEDSGVEK